ncbi:MAG: hypothetical protein AAGA66_02915 [Bacteroidota bacterium]
MKKEELKKLDLLLDESLSSEEKQRILDDLKTNSSYDFYEAAVFALKVEGFKKEVAALRYRKKKRGKLFRYAIAASITFCLLSVSFSLFRHATPSSKELFQTYFEPYPNVISTRGETPSDYWNHYDNGDFKGAYEAFPQHSENDTINFYLGITLISLNRFDEAIGALNRLDETSRYQELKNWYMALAHLGADQSQEAVEFLKMITPNDRNYEKSQKILKEIK